MTSQLSAAPRAAAADIHPDEAGTGLIISYGTWLDREDFTRHVETAACIRDLLDQHEYHIEPATAPPGPPARIPPYVPQATGSADNEIKNYLQAHSHNRNPPRRRAAPVNLSLATARATAKASSRQLPSR